MSSEDTVKKMISYVEQEERNMQAARFLGETKASKADIVNAILKKLDQEVKNED